MEILSKTVHGEAASRPAKSPCSWSAIFPFRLGLLALVVIGVLSGGCGRGYVVNRNKNEVIWETWDEGRGTVKTVVANADAATFKPLKLRGPKGFARDRSRVYLEGKVIGGADPETFRELNVPGQYYRDSRRVFLYTGGGVAMLVESDADSFRVINSAWSRDRNRVYLYEQGFVPRDIDSFEPLVRIWSRDRKAYYYGLREVAQADRETFHISEQEPWFAYDRNHLFWHGWVVDGCDAKTFHIQTMTSGYDDRFNYRFEEAWDSSTDVSFRKMIVHKEPLTKEQSKPSLSH